jgi:hypothetical protein
MPDPNSLSPPPVTRRMSVNDGELDKFIIIIKNFPEIKRLNDDVRNSVITTVSIYLTGGVKTKQHVNLKTSLLDCINSLWLGGAKVNVQMNDLEAALSETRLTLEESLSDILEAQGFSSIVQWGLRLCCCRDNQTEAIIAKVTETILNFKSSKSEMTRETHENDGFSDHSDDGFSDSTDKTLQYSLKRP